MLMTYFFLAIGGAIGACCRFALSQSVQSLLNQPSLAATWFSTWAIGTWAVNILGSFLMGLSFVLLQEKAMLSESLKLMIMPGFLGAFTTFSTFSLETLNHFLQAQYWQAAVYVIASVTVCVLAAYAGMMLAR